MKNQTGHEVRIEKMIKKPVGDVFRALGEGRLFMNCGADSGSMEIDFRVGGKYRIHFKSYDIFNLGEFLEIVPNQKIVLNWCSSQEKPLKPDTTVTIELFADGDHTRLRLVHSGFKTEEDRDQHEGGWNAGLADLTQEILEGKLRIVRAYASPVAKLFETCQQRMVKGEVIESVPNKKLVFDWDSTRVSLSFDEEDDGGSSVELVHSLLKTDALQKKYRLGWEKVTEEMAQTLGRN